MRSARALSHQLVCELAGGRAVDLAVVLVAAVAVSSVGRVAVDLENLFKNLGAIGVVFG
jgi:hypothetical protein